MINAPSPRRNPAGSLFFLHFAPTTILSRWEPQHAFAVLLFPPCENVFSPGHCSNLSRVCLAESAAAPCPGTASPSTRDPPPKETLLRAFLVVRPGVVSLNESLPTPRPMPRPPPCRQHNRSFAEGKDRVCCPPMASMVFCQPFARIPAFLCAFFLVLDPSLARRFPVRQRLWWHRWLGTQPTIAASASPKAIGHTNPRGGHFQSHTQPDLWRYQRGPDLACILLPRPIPPHPSPECGGCGALHDGDPDPPPSPPRHRRHGRPLRPLLRSGPSAPSLPVPYGDGTWDVANKIITTRIPIAGIKYPARLLSPPYPPHGKGARLGFEGFFSQTAQRAERGGGHLGFLPPLSHRTVSLKCNGWEGIAPFGSLPDPEWSPGGCTERVTPHHSFRFLLSGERGGEGWSHGSALPTLPPLPLPSQAPPLPPTLHGLAEGHTTIVDILRVYLEERAPPPEDFGDLPQGPPSLDPIRRGGWY